MSDGAVLITGADGYLGRLVVRHLLATTDRNLLLWVRASSRAQAIGRCVTAFGPGVRRNPRIRCTGGDLTRSEPFAGVDPTRISGIVHLAAVTSFAVDADTATSVNVDGTARLLALARRCRALERVCLASTLYVSGLRSGSIPEVAFDSTAGFANEYERSKCRAEQLALAATDLPVALVRVATVLADDEDAEIGQRNAVHHTLDLLRHGLLSLMPGDPAIPIYLTTGGIAVKAIAAALDRGSGVYHAAERAADSLLLGEALDIAFDTFSGDDAFLRRGVRRPLFADLRTFDLLCGAAHSLGGGVLAQAMGSLLPFAPQLYVAKQVGNDRLRELLPDLARLDARALFAATCATLANVGGETDVRIA